MVITFFILKKAKGAKGKASCQKGNKSCGYINTNSKKIS
jgi:hypothetical protein